MSPGQYINTRRKNVIWILSLITTVCFLVFCYSIFLGKNAFSTSLATPIQTALEDGAYTRGVAYTVAWTAAPGAVQYNYESYHDAAGKKKRWSSIYSTPFVTFYNIADSVYWWRVQAVDSMGNKSNWSLLRKVTVDKVAPIGSISENSLSAQSSIRNSSPTITGTVSAQEKNLATHTFTIKNPQGAVTTIGPLTATSNTHSFTLDTSAGDGIYEVTYVAIDKAGNRSDGINGASPAKITVTIDTTAPDAPVLTGEANQVVQPSDVTYNWNASQATDVQTYIYKSFSSQLDATTPDTVNAVTVQSFPAGQATYSLTAPSGDTEGTVWYRVAAVDKAGNTTWSNEIFTVTVDGTVPEAPIFEITDVANNGTTKTIDVATTWTQPSSDTINYNLRYWNDNPNSPWKEASPNLITTTELTWNGMLEGGDGQYFFQVQAVDRAGNESAWSDVYTVTLDTTIPVVETDPVPTNNPTTVTPPVGPEVVVPTSEPAPASTSSPPSIVRNNTPTPVVEEAPVETDTPETTQPSTQPNSAVTGGETSDSQEIKGTTDDNPAGFSAASVWGWVVAVGIILSGLWAAAAFNGRRNKGQGL